MAPPTSVSVLVDDTEYSRYETSKNTITATVTVSGGAPYSSDPITVELIKARRSRDAVVATTSVSFTGNEDPQETTAEFFLPDIVDSDLISLIRHGKYFVQATHEATDATASIGSGANGTVTLTAATAGADGNDFTIEVTAPAGTSSLTATQVGDAITVDLSVSSGVPVAAENTATLVAAAINAATDDVTASASGTGADSLSSAEGPTSFTGGTDEITAESGDFDIRIVTVERLKRDYLFGVPLHSTSVKLPKFDPSSITGVTISEVSNNHPEGFGTLTYIYHEDDTANATIDVGSGANGTVTITADGDDVSGSAGNAVLVEVVVPAGTSALSASYSSGTLTILSLIHI